MARTSLSRDWEKEGPGYRLRFSEYQGQPELTRTFTYGLAGPLSSNYRVFESSCKLQRDLAGAGIDGVAQVRCSRATNNDFIGRIPNCHTDLYQAILGWEDPIPSRALARLLGSVASTLVGVRQAFGRTHGRLRLQSILLRYAQDDHQDDAWQRAVCLLTDFLPPPSAEEAPARGDHAFEAEDLKTLGDIIAGLAQGEFDPEKVRGLPAPNDPQAQRRFDRWPAWRSLAADLRGSNEGPTRVQSLESLQDRLAELGGRGRKKPQRIAFDPLPDVTYGDPPLPLHASASSLLQVKLSVVSGPARLSADLKAVVLISAGQVRIRAAQSGDASYEPAEAVEREFVIQRKPQSITFDPPVSNLQSSRIPLTATADSGLPVSLRVVSGPAELLDPRILKFSGPGKVVVVASQPGDANHEPAPVVERRFEAVASPTLPKSQAIQFDEIPHRSCGEPPVDLVASASSGLPVRFEIIEGPARLEGRRLSVTGPGKVTVRATQPGDGHFDPAPPVDRAFLVAKRGQTIRFEPLPNRFFGDPPFELQASASSGLDPQFSIAQGPARLDGRTVTLTGPGKVVIRAAQPGNAVFDPAPLAERSFLVERRAQTITFDPLNNLVLGARSFSLKASATSGLKVGFAVLSGPAECKGDVVTLKGAGKVEIAADQPGNEQYDPAPRVRRSFTVDKAEQHIQFSPLPDRAFTPDPLLLEAQADSGLPVEFRLISGAATLQGNRLTLRGPGEIRVSATQAGNGDYCAASVETSFRVAKAEQAIDLRLPSSLPYGGTCFVPSATATSGLPVEIAAVSGPATVQQGRVTLLGVGDVWLEAAQPGNEVYHPARTVRGGFTVTKAPQTITFEPLANCVLSHEPVELSAVATSQLPVEFEVVSGPAHTDGNRLVITGPGVVEVAASQPGDSNHAAAETVTQAFRVRRPFPWRSVIAASLVLGVLSGVAVRAKRAYDRERALREATGSLLKDDPSAALKQLGGDSGHESGGDPALPAATNTPRVYRQSQGAGTFSVGEDSPRLDPATKAKVRAAITRAPQSVEQNVTLRLVSGGVLDTNIPLKLALVSQIPAIDEALTNRVGWSAQLSATNPQVGVNLRRPRFTVSQGLPLTVEAKSDAPSTQVPVALTLTNAAGSGTMSVHVDLVQNEPPVVTIMSGETSWTNGTTTHITNGSPVEFTGQVTDDTLPNLNRRPQVGPSNWQITHENGSNAGPDDFDRSDRPPRLTLTFKRRGTYRLTLSATDSVLSNNATMTLIANPSPDEIAREQVQRLYESVATQMTATRPNVQTLWKNLTQLDSSRQKLDTNQSRTLNEWLTSFKKPPTLAKPGNPRVITYGDSNAVMTLAASVRADLDDPYRRDWTVTLAPSADPAGRDWRQGRMEIEFIARDKGLTGLAHSLAIPSIGAPNQAMTDLDSALALLRGSAGNLSARGQSDFTEIYTKLKSLELASLPDANQSVSNNRATLSNALAELHSPPGLLLGPQRGELAGETNTIDASLTNWNFGLQPRWQLCPPPGEPWPPELNSAGMVLHFRPPRDAQAGSRTCRVVAVWPDATNRVLTSQIASVTVNIRANTRPAISPLPINPISVQSAPWTAKFSVTDPEDRDVSVWMTNSASRERIGGTRAEGASSFTFTVTDLVHGENRGWSIVASDGAWEVSHPLRLVYEWPQPLDGHFDLEWVPNLTTNGHWVGKARPGGWVGKGLVTATQIRKWQEQHPQTGIQIEPKGTWTWAQAQEFLGVLETAGLPQERRDEGWVVRLPNLEEMIALHKHASSAAVQLSGPVGGQPEWSATPNLHFVDCSDAGKNREWSVSRMALGPTDDLAQVEGGLGFRVLVVKK